MQLDFHYYATYCAAFLAGYPTEESEEIAYFAQFVDCCSPTLLTKVGGPQAAATTQLQSELANEGDDILSLQRITRIWASFHFLPGDLQRTRRHAFGRYLQKLRLVCDTNGPLLKETVELARGKGLPAVGVAMHILADTWAHRYFAGTPSYVINNTSAEFYELLEKEEGWEERKVRFNHNPATADDPETSYYTNTAPQMQENTIMNLGHGRAGHLPDYSYARYRYMPAWEEYREVIKDNPAEYYFAFAQMIYAMRCLRTEEPFAVDTYDYEAAQPWKAAVSEVLNKRQLDAAPDWRALAEKITGRAPAEFSTERCQAAYLEASEEEKDNTPLGQFILAALAQKSMVTHHVFVSGSLLAGISVDFATKGFRGMRDFQKLLRHVREGGAS